jgi:hypothetical protein
LVRQQNYYAFCSFFPAMQYIAQTQIASSIKRESHNTISLLIKGILSNNIHKLLNMKTLPIIKVISARISFLFFIFYSNLLKGSFIFKAA